MSQLQESFLQVGSSSDWRTQNDTHGVIPDAFSMLQRAWWSILMQTCYRRWDLGFPLTPQWARLNRWPGSILTLQSKRSSRQCSLQGKRWPLFFWDAYRVIMLVDFTSPSSTINAAGYQEILKRLKQAIWKKESRIVDHRSSFALQCSTLQCCCNFESLQLLGLGKYSTSTIQSWSATTETSICPQRWKSTSEVSDSTSVKTFKMNQEMVTWPGPTFFYEGLAKLIYRWINDYVQKWS